MLRSPWGLPCGSPLKLLGRMKYIIIAITIQAIAIIMNPPLGSPSPPEKGKFLLIRKFWMSQKFISLCFTLPVALAGPGRPSVKHSLSVQVLWKEWRKCTLSYRVFFLTGAPLKVLSVRLHSKSHPKSSKCQNLLTGWHLKFLGGYQWKKPPCIYPFIIFISSGAAQVTWAGQPSCRGRRLMPWPYLVPQCRNKYPLHLIFTELECDLTGAPSIGITSPEGEYGTCLALSYLSLPTFESWYFPCQRLSQDCN